MFNLRCKCGRRLKVPESMIGKVGRCPACKTALRLVAPHWEEHGGTSNDALLEITEGPDHVGEVILLAGPGPIEVGRLPGKDLLLPSGSVSRNHCQLLRVGAAWRVVDQQSAAGVRVNGERVAARELSRGDSLRIGDYHLSYVSWDQGDRHEAKVAPPIADSEGNNVASAVDHRSEDQPEDADLLGLGEGLASGSLYDLSDGDVIDVAPPEPQRIVAPQVQTGGPTCPSCGRALAPNARICVSCGVDLKTGRAILTAHSHDFDAMYERAESIIRVISWFIWSGLYPIASEGFGLRRPYCTWLIAAITTVTSLLFLGYEASDSPKMASLRDYMLWVGDAKPNAQQLEFLYTCTSLGDGAAFQARYDASKQELVAKLAKQYKTKGESKEAVQADVEAAVAVAHDELVMTAHQSLPPDKQCLGHFAGYQLLTCAFVHAGLMHLIGNMIFLLVFGTRINALIGNIAMAVLYPVLTLCASIVYMASEQGSLPHPCVGNSGVVMGLAGMYLVLMPVHKVHMVGWWRLPWLSLLRQTFFPLYYKLWAMRGFWVVLLYIGFDIVDVLLGSEDGVAHWAHLGGFFFGMGIGVLLLFTRLVNCRGADMVSALMGRYAWALVGKPDPNRKGLLEYGW